MNGNTKRMERGLAVVRLIRQLNENDTFEITKRADKRYEYHVMMNSEYVKCAEDNTSCRNDGACYDCGVLLISRKENML